MNGYQIFTLPGLNNSGPLHWQTLWEKAFGFTRIQQENWDEPVCEDWIFQIHETLEAYDPSKIILIGHSLACCTIAHWAKKYGTAIHGALLVGPSDVEAPSYPEGTTGFKPMPLNKLPFPSTVIASADDFYVSIARARFFADHWGSSFVNAGALGHINAASDIGAWEEGQAWLKKLTDS